MSQRRPPTTLRAMLVALFFAVLIWHGMSCGDSSSDSSLAGFAESENPDGFFGGGGSFAATGGSTGGAQGMPPPPPENEIELQVPQVSRDFVFVASTDLDAVAQIDAQTLAIDSIPVGDRPTLVVAHPDTNTIAVFNEGSGDVSVVHASTDADAITRRLELAPRLNQMVMSPLGDFALLYLDATRIEPGQPLGSFQDVSLVRLRQDQEVSRTLTVGFNVRTIQFDSSGARAFVITDDAIHPIDLNAAADDPAQYNPGDAVTLDPSVFGDADTREVSVTPDGAFAVVRSLSAPSLFLIDLQRRVVRSLDLNGVATDLDLAPDGRRALVVVRDTQELLLVPIPGGFDDPTQVTVVSSPDTIPVGQAALMPDGIHAVVFSTVVEGNATLGALNLDTATLSPHRLGSGKPITGAALSPGGQWVYVQHRSTPNSIDPVMRAEGFSIVDFNLGTNDTGVPFDKFFQTDAATDALVFSRDDGQLFVLVPGPQQVLQVNLATFRERLERLGSPPALIGVMPAVERVFVAQEHPVGRISFIDIESGRLQTVTGFELNSRTR